MLSNQQDRTTNMDELERVGSDESSSSSSSDDDGQQNSSLTSGDTTSNVTEKNRIVPSNHSDFAGGSIKEAKRPSADGALLMPNARMRPTIGDSVMRTTNFGATAPGVALGSIVQHSVFALGRPPKPASQATSGEIDGIGPPEGGGVLQPTGGVPARARQPILKVKYSVLRKLTTLMIREFRPCDPMILRVIVAKVCTTTLVYVQLSVQSVVRLYYTK